MKRYALDELLLWKAKPNKKPLIIKGARQVGKTWLMKEFAKSYDKSVYFNFDKNEKLRSFFDKNLDIKKIIENLSSISQTEIDENTLIIFDEIQESHRALTSLKYFNEDYPQYQIIAAGSLLGIALHQGTSFPVGKTDFLALKPMSFYEFLEAQGEKKLVDIAKETKFDLINYYKQDFIEFLKKYLFVGGMPEVVQNFIDEKNFDAVRDIQKKIIDTYELDFSKHAPANTSAKIKMLLDSTSQQLAKENKKFTYGAVKEGARAKDFEIALQWLLDCSIIHKARRISKSVLPLKFYADIAAFKVYLLDVGLMSAMSNLPIEALLDKTIVFEEFKGALTENYVLCCLLKSADDIFYWSPDSGRAELDFVIQIKEKIVGIEVKASENLQAKSLKVFKIKYPQNLAIRTSLADYRKEQNLINIPLYLMENFTDFLK